MYIADFLGLLKNVKKTGKQWTARCPSHSDKKNSLSISKDADKILVHCHAGCSTEDIINSLNLNLGDLFEKKEEKKITSKEKVKKPKIAKLEEFYPNSIIEDTYHYVNENNEIVHTKIRYKDKFFLQCRPYDNEKFIDNLDGVEKILFNLPNLLNAIKNRQKVFIVEGEKDVINMIKIGLVATTVTNGGGYWNDSYNKIFNGAYAVVIPDNDSTGQKMLKNILDSFKKTKTNLRSLKVVDLGKEIQGFKEKGDISDFIEIEKGQAKIKLLEMIKNSKELMPKKDKIEIFSAKDLQDMEIDPPRFIIDGLLPEQGLHLLAGSPKIGKSWQMIEWGLKISQGIDIWGKCVNQCDVLYLALEDNLSRLKDRMDKILQEEKAPFNFRYGIRANQLNNGFIEQIEDFLHEYPDTKLIIIDTFQKIRGATSVQNPYMQDYADSGKLKEFADSKNISILIIHHLRKMTDDSDPVNMISGSTGLSGVMDTMFVLKKEQRKDAEATLTVIGRDSEQKDWIIRFDKQSYTWKLETEDAERFKEEREFNNNAIVIFLKNFITAENPSWEGTATELFDKHWTNFKNCTAFEDTIEGFPRSIIDFSRKLSAIENKLKRTNIVIDRDRDKLRTIKIKFIQ